MRLSLLRCNTHQWPLPVPVHQRTHGGVLLVTEGQGIVSVNDRDYEVRTGDVAFYLPLEPHAYGSPSSEVMSATMITYEFGPRSRETEEEFALFGDRRVFPGISEAPHMFDMIYAAARSGNEHRIRSAESLLAALFHRLLSECSSRPADSRGNPVDAAMEVLYGDYTAKLNEVAAELNVSAEAIRKQFQKHFGDSPMRYFTGYHVQRLATVLERTDIPLRELAEEFGFYDEFHLSRVFKRYAGVPPAEYRRASRERTRRNSGYESDRS